MVVSLSIIQASKDLPPLTKGDKLQQGHQYPIQEVKDPLVHKFLTKDNKDPRDQRPLTQVLRVHLDLKLLTKHPKARRDHRLHTHQDHHINKARPVHHIKDLPDQLLVTQVPNNHQDLALQHPVVNKVPLVSLLRDQFTDHPHSKHRLHLLIPDRHRKVHQQHLAGKGHQDRILVADIKDNKPLEALVDSLNNHPRPLGAILNQVDLAYLSREQVPNFQVQVPQSPDLVRPNLRLENTYRPSMVNEDVQRSSSTDAS